MSSINIFATDDSAKDDNASSTWIVSNFQGNYLVSNTGNSSYQIQYSPYVQSLAILF